jgi:hypothetical protein
VPAVADQQAPLCAMESELMAMNTAAKIHVEILMVGPSLIEHNGWQYCVFRQNFRIARRC